MKKTEQFLQLQAGCCDSHEYGVCLQQNGDGHEGQRDEGKNEEGIEERDRLRQSEQHPGSHPRVGSHHEGGLDKRRILGLPEGLMQVQLK